MEYQLAFGSVWSWEKWFLCLQEIPSYSIWDGSWGTAVSLHEPRKMTEEQLRIWHLPMTGISAENWGRHSPVLWFANHTLTQYRVKFFIRKKYLVRKLLTFPQTSESGKCVITGWLKCKWLTCQTAFVHGLLKNWLCFWFSVDINVTIFWLFFLTLLTFAKIGLYKLIWKTI